MKDQIYYFGTNGVDSYLPESKAIVLQQDSTGFLDDTKDRTVSVTPKNKSITVDFIPWGENNLLPNEVLEKIHANVTVSANANFNSQMCYGDGVMVVKKVKKDGEVKFEEVIESEAPEVFEFLENNNIVRFFQDCAMDMVAFGDSFVELIFDRALQKIVKIRQKEATFSRLSKQNKATGQIEYHGYSSLWGEKIPDDCIITPLLDREAPLYDLKMRVGLIPDEKTGKINKTKEQRFVVSLGLPTPGRFYYNKPYWWSIFTSGWYDFSCLIPFFKKALMQNEMVLKYEVSINEDFWQKLFKAEGITKPEEQATRKIGFLKQLDEFLAGHKNAGKSFIKHFKYDQLKGFERHDIIIKPIESFIKGGEYIEDSEEATNVICYAMGVHPSVQGASPGKNKNINGTEARELFIIKQSLTKPLRQALLLPLYMAKAVNGWNKDYHFVIPNIMLTTLDQGTGQTKNIGNQKIS